MYIQSEIGKQMRYGDNAIDAFVTAVDNGQARLGMQILVDVIVAFSDKLDELELALKKEDDVIVAAVVSSPAQEEPKVEEIKTLTKEEEVQSKNKVTAKEVPTEK